MGLITQISRRFTITGQRKVETRNQVDLFEKVVIPTLVVSGFFPEKQAQSIMEELENQ